MKVLENLLTNQTRAYANRAGHSRQMRGVATSSKKNSEMGNHTDKRKQRYVDHMRDRSKLTCLIHSPGHSSYECRVLNDFGTKYAKERPPRICGMRGGGGELLQGCWRRREQRCGYGL